MKSRKKNTETTLLEAIKMMELSNNDEIFIHTQNKADDTFCSKVDELNSDLLKKNVVLIQGNYGGMEHNYGCYLFILE